MSRIKWNGKPPSPQNQGLSNAIAKMCYFPILDMGERGVPPKNKDEAVQKPKRPTFQSLIRGPGVLNVSSILSKIVPRH